MMPHKHGAAPSPHAPQPSCEAAQTRANAATDQQLAIFDHRLGEEPDKIEPLPFYFLGNLRALNLLNPTPLRSSNRLGPCRLSWPDAAPSGALQRFAAIWQA
jgi:hypothetical protein